MKKDLPVIPFESKSDAIQNYGVEILTMADFRERKENLNHSVEIPHQLAFNLIVFYAEGNTRHLVDFVWHEVQANTVIHIAKGQVSAFKIHEDIEGFLILFTEDYFKQQLNQLPKNEIVRLFNANLFSPKIRIPESSNVNDYFHLFFKEYQEEKSDFHKKNIINALFRIIFSKLEQLKQHQTFHITNEDHLELFMEFKKLVESDFTKSRNADYYASKLKITYKHLNVVCKEVVNTTAKNFIDEFVVLEAKRNLINSSIKSNELAYKMGFNEPTNFVKYFKKLTGFTPNSFKKEQI